MTVNCQSRQVPAQKMATGAEQPEKYLPLLAGKRVALVVNHTAMAGEKHLTDLLIENNISVIRIFAPEHGFRGEASAGETVSDGRDEKTGLEIVSCTGKTGNPQPTICQGLISWSLTSRMWGAGFTPICRPFSWW